MFVLACLIPIHGYHQKCELTAPYVQNFYDVMLMAYCIFNSERRLKEKQTVLPMFIVRELQRPEYLFLVTAARCGDS